MFRSPLALFRNKSSEPRANSPVLHCLLSPGPPFARANGISWAIACASDAASDDLAKVTNGARFSLSFEQLSGQQAGSRAAAPFSKDAPAGSNWLGS